MDPHSFSLRSCITLNFRALQVEGVVGAIDASDLDDERNRFAEMDEPVFAKGKVEFNGQVGNMERSRSLWMNPNRSNNIFKCK